MALVPLQPILFSADVMHSIRYGKPDATDEEVIAAEKLPTLKILSFGYLISATAF
jgi:ABC-type multidrug transport system fused ATPase/permease subunit